MWQDGHSRRNPAVPGGALDKRQSAIMQQHVYHTYYLLGDLGPECKKLQQWAGYHHERLDGTGYPLWPCRC